jgi:hypothetical protein
VAPTAIAFLTQAGAVMPSLSYSLPVDTTVRMPRARSPSIW